MTTEQPMIETALRFITQLPLDAVRQAIVEDESIVELLEGDELETLRAAVEHYRGTIGWILLTRDRVISSIEAQRPDIAALLRTHPGQIWVQREIDRIRQI